MGRGSKGRSASGYRVRWHGDAAAVRFRHETRRYEFGLGRFVLPSGGRDTAAANQAAAIRYGEVVSGRWKPYAGLAAPCGQPLDALIGLWIEAIEGTYDVETIKTWVIYGRKWVTFFGAFERVHESGIADYWRARLKSVLRKTVSKELSALRNFLSYCVEKKLLDKVPVFTEMPSRSTGVRSGTQRAKSVHVTPEQVDAWLAELPELSVRTPKFAVRDYAIVLWETGLRPETVQCLRSPEHYSRGAKTLSLTPEIDKARYDRPLPLSLEARAALDRHCPENGVIFGSHTWTKQFDKASQRAGMPKGFAPYDLRHARARYLLQASGDILGVGYLLGHKQATTTNTYLTAKEEDGRKVLDSVGGRDRGKVLDPRGGRALDLVGGRTERGGLNSGNGANPVGGKRLSEGNGLGLIGGRLGEELEAGERNQGDRRGLNPRQLEPQSTSVVKSVRKPEESGGPARGGDAERRHWAVSGVTSGEVPPTWEDSSALQRSRQKQAVQALEAIRSGDPSALRQATSLLAELAGVEVPVADGEEEAS